MKQLILVLCVAIGAGSSLLADDFPTAKGASVPPRTLPSNQHAFLLAPVQRVPDSLQPWEMVDVVFTFPDEDGKTTLQTVRAIRLLSVQQTEDGTDRVTLAADADTASLLSGYRTLPSVEMSLKKSAAK